MPLSYMQFLIGLLLASGTVWAPIFAFAYSRRQFGGSPRNYLIAFAATWFATVAVFVAMSIAEHQASG